MPDDLSIQCECGTRLPVTAGMAGSTTTCTCGRAVAVPGLGELRRIAGREAYVTNAAEAVVRALNTGELPGKLCVHCQSPTDRLVHCNVVCETSSRKRTTLGDDGDLLGAFGRLLMPIWISRRTVVTEIQGRDTTVPAVLCLCPACEAAVGNPRRKRTLRRLLNMVPQYAALLREYPRAKIKHVSC